MSEQPMKNILWTIGAAGLCACNVPTVVDDDVTPPDDDPIVVEIGALVDVIDVGNGYEWQIRALDNWPSILPA